MKLTTTLVAVFAALSAAAPTNLVERQSSSTRKELENGTSANCPKAILIFARGSTEAGNMGEGVGPALASSLKIKQSSLWVQGVGGAYDASLTDNFLLRGTSEKAIAEGVRLFTLAKTKCPNASVVTGGYSQGAALIAAAVSDLTSTVQAQVKGAALFGYTKNQQNGGKIPNYPVSRTKIFCADGDLVCQGTLIIAPPHFSYDDDAQGDGADFLASMI